MTERAKVVIELDGAGDIIVDIDGSDMFPTRTSDTAETFPQTLTADATYYTETDPASTATISLKVNGVELGQPSVTRTFNRDGRYVYRPNWGKAARSRFEDAEAYLGMPAVGATTAVKAAVTSTAISQTITTGITNPDTARNVTATSGGTAGDIGAVQVIVHGTNVDGVAISETLPIFTANSATTVVGNKAFKTVTSIIMPAHDGLGATTAVGTGAKLGLPRPLARNIVAAAYLNNVREGTAPTIATSVSAVESNTATLNSTLDGTAVHIAFF